MGGKKFEARKISETIVNYSIKNNFEIKGYCEPFAGMLSVFKQITERMKENNIDPSNIPFKFNDINKNLIKLLKGLKNGWKPPKKIISKEEYEKLKNQKSNSLKKIYVGYAYSFMGMYYSSYFIKETSMENQRESSIGLGKLLSQYNTELLSGDYTKIKNLKGYIIYCDPPYKNTSQEYGLEEVFDNDSFEKWVNQMKKDNLVFISEYKKIIKESKLILTQKRYNALTDKDIIERLYVAV